MATTKKKSSKNKKRKKVKNYQWFILFIVFIVGLSLGLTLGIIGNITKNKPGNKYYNYTLNVLSKDNCTNDLELFYTFKDGRKIYTNCINSLEIKKGNANYNYLDKELNKNEDLINDIISNLKYVLDYDDGGSTSYQSKSSRIYTNNDITLIKCHKLINAIDKKFNEDIYLGLEGMEYSNGYCEERNDTFNFNYDCSFTKTYNIVNILSNYQTDNPNYNYIVVDALQNAYPKTISIPTSLKKKLKANKYYEFVYHIKGSSKTLINEEDIDEFINNDNLNVTLEIKETKKTGLNQINDSVCKPMED